MLGITDPGKFDWENISLSACANGNYMDAHFTLQLFYIFQKKMEEKKMDKVFFKVICPALNEFALIEYNGINVSTEKLDEVGKQLRNNNIDQEDLLYDCKGITKEDNLSSNNDLIDILYTRDGGLELYPPDKTAKGSPSVSAPTLELLLDFINQELASRVKVEKS